MHEKKNNYNNNEMYLECHMPVSREQTDAVDRFKYLGRWIPSNWRSDMNIKCKISQAKKAFVDIRYVLCTRNIRMGIRKRFLVLLVLLYGCESWMVSKNREKRLGAAEM